MVLLQSFILINLILDNLEIHKAIIELQKTNLELIDNLNALNLTQKTNLENLETNLQKTFASIENHQKMLVKNYLPGRNEIFDLTVGTGLYAVLIYYYVYYVI